MAQSEDCFFASNLVGMFMGYCSIDRLEWRVEFSKGELVFSGFLAKISSE